MHSKIAKLKAPFPAEAATLETDRSHPATARIASYLGWSRRTFDVATDSTYARLNITAEPRKTNVGKFIYEGSIKTEIEDRALTHLQMVITAKLRRGEPFNFSFKDDMSVGGGRTTLWIHAGSSLVFKYHGSRQPPLNRYWVDALAFTANSPSGLYLVPEPDTAGFTEEIRLPALGDA